MPRPKDPHKGKSPPKRLNIKLGQILFHHDPGINELAEAWKVRLELHVSKYENIITPPTCQTSIYGVYISYEYQIINKDYCLEAFKWAEESRQYEEDLAAWKLDEKVKQQQPNFLDIDARILKTEARLVKLREIKEDILAGHEHEHAKLL